MSRFNFTFAGKNDTFNASFGGDQKMGASFGDVQVVETGNYERLNNKPSINDVVLIGNKTFEDLGDHTMGNLEIKAVFDRVFRKGV